MFLCLYRKLIITDKHEHDEALNEMKAVEAYMSHLYGTKTKVYKDLDDHKYVIDNVDNLLNPITSYNGRRIGNLTSYRRNDNFNKYFDGSRNYVNTVDNIKYISEIQLPQLDSYIEMYTEYLAILAFRLSCSQYK